MRLIVIMVAILLVVLVGAYEQIHHFGWMQFIDRPSGTGASN